MVSAQAADVRELGVVQDAQTRNRRAPIQAKEHAASATGTRP
jgi:hypothetical protein